MRRPIVIASVVTALAIFLVLSALLARALSVGGAEDAAITDLVRAEASGRPAAVESLIAGCAAQVACRRRAAGVAGALRHPGHISIIQIQPSAGFSLGSTSGTARVAWLAGGSLPRVQCVRVAHRGNVLSGFTVVLERVSVRIASNADCPRTF
jgi:hypothetical protein